VDDMKDTGENRKSEQENEKINEKPVEEQKKECPEEKETGEEIQKEKPEDGSPEKPEEKPEEKTEEKPEEKTEEKPEEKAEEKPEEKAEEKPEEKTEEKAAEELKKKGFRWKKDPRDEKIEELTDLLKRNLAEFDNFRKRTEKEKTEMFDMGTQVTLEKLLPVIDNFERSLAAVPNSEECRAYAEGMQMIYKQLLKNLEEAGAKPIDCKGKPFNPEFHNAVMHVEDENEAENVVVEELQKGYMYKNKVLRHSMVKVAN